MEMKLGLALLGKDVGPERARTLAKECEELGYERLWPSNDKFFRDTYVMAAVLAEHTSRTHIGTFVADPYTHHPALTAMALATLDEASSGRAILGLGAGGTGFPAMGIQRLKPATAIKEAVQVIRRMWGGETVEFVGEVIECHHARLEFPPQREIPIVVATRGDLVLRTAGEVADEVMISTYAEPAGVRHAMSVALEGASAVGRPPEKLCFNSRVDVCISSDRRAAMDAVKPFLAWGI